MAATHDEKSHKCDFCALKLENYHLFCQHLRQFHNIAFINCEYCDLELPSKSELLKHVSDQHTYGGNPRVECSICPATFLSLKGLTRHMNQNHNPNAKDYPCQECDKIYKNSSSLLKHTKLVHRPLTYIKCDKCPKIFYKKQTLKCHQNVEHNTNFKKLKCPLCPSLFKYRSNLSHHLRRKHYSNIKIVSNEHRPHNKCNLCYELFDDKATLLSHRKTFHKRLIDIFSCDQCPAVFKLREAFDNHLWEEHKIIKDKYVKEEDEDYVFEEFVDFENIMLNDIELNQLIQVRKSRKFNQKLVLITYKQQQVNDSFVIDESDVETIRNDVRLFFNSMINPKKGICENVSPDRTQPANHTENDQESNFPATELNENKPSLKRKRNKSQSTDTIKQNRNCAYDEQKVESKKTYSDNSPRVSRVKKSHQMEMYQNSTADKINTRDESLKCNKIKELNKNKKNHSQVVINENKLTPIENVKSTSQLKNSTDTLKTKDSILSLKDKVILKPKKKPKYSKLTRRSHKCTICNKKFKLKSNLVNHTSSVHLNSKSDLNSKSVGTSDCNKSDSNIMFPCEHCHALFPCVELLLNHCLWQHCK